MYAMSINMANSLGINLLILVKLDESYAFGDSVLFDGNIPTLTGLDGDMWETQLLALNTSTLSSITFNFNGVSNYGGVGIIKVVMFKTVFNCMKCFKSSVVFAKYNS